MKTIAIIRWICVVPAAVISWYAVLIIGMITLSLINDFCPYGEVVSGLCFATWYDYAEQIIIIIFVGFSAALVVLTASWVAPGKKALVAVIVFLCGLLIALLLTIHLGSWWELAAAISAGLLAVWQVHRKQRVQ